jgi:Zn-dependent metalloprotease
MKSVFRLLILALALAGCTRSHPSSMAQVQGAINSQPQVAAMQAQPGQTLIHSKTVQNTNLRTEKYQHYYNGLEVLGSGVSFHETIDHSETQKITTHLDAFSNNQVSSTPTITPEEAIAIAQSIGHGKSVEAPALKIYPVITPSGKSSTAGNSTKQTLLIYQVDLDNGKFIWIDAHHGTHLATLKYQDGAEAAQSPEAQQQVMSALNQGIHIADSVETLPIEVNTSCQSWDDEGNPILINPQSCTEDYNGTSKITPADADAERATENAQKFLNYFQTTFERNSFDGKGSPIVSVIHVGQHYDNALWDRKRQFMSYGEGDGTTTRDYTYALDIAGHELTHGVIQSSAALRSIGETGALNESIADFFGKMVEGQGDWTIGDALGLTTAFEGIRDLKDPARLQGEFFTADGNSHTQAYPATRAQMAPLFLPCSEENDFCAVHFNATVPGHVWYGIYESLGKEKAEKLLYVTLTHFLSELADFDGAAHATEQACDSLFSYSDCDQVRDLMVAAGMNTP